MLRLPDVPRRADIAVFGGSGFYSFLADTETVPTETPYGPPSADPVVGLIDGRRVAFLPRHGHDHSVPAHRVNHRANVWAMAALGAQVLVSPFACGSLRRELVPGDFVVVDQLVDRGHGRDGTFFDGPETFHLPFADPYDDDLRRQMIDHARRLGYVVHDGGTVVVIPGPRFSTRAESRWHAAFPNMTPWMLPAFVADARSNSRRSWVRYHALSLSIAINWCCFEVCRRQDSCRNGSNRICRTHHA